MTNGTQRSSVYNQKNGRYVLGGTTEVSAGFVEWWERIKTVNDPSDIVYFLEAKYVGRPDLLAYSWFGDCGLEWVIPMFNDILDPDEELVEGKLLLIPTQEKVDALRSNIKVGGIPSTRK
jgi:hypothetical protein